jgi:hypothetical protein
MDFRIGWTVLALSALRLGAELAVSTNFSSGSAQVLALDAATQTVRITPAGDPARGIPNWWYLRVDGIDPARPLILQVVARETTTPGGPLNPSWTLPRQAAVSVDGKSWTQTPPGDSGTRQMTYRVPATGGTLWLAWGPPFTPEDAAESVARIARNLPSGEAFTLATSREHRSVPALHIKGDGPMAASRPVIWVTARQHAWECGGSWVGIGLAEWLAGTEEPAVWLRQHAEFFLVPVMDVDHVATGDGGKHALPDDHNRDWSASPHWPEVAAAQQQILQSVQEGRLAVFLDLHNPHAGAKQQMFYVDYPPFVGPAAAAASEKFIGIARAEFGEITLVDGKPSRPDQLPIWERISVSWVIRHGNPETVSLTVETPWNTPDGTPAGYRETGRKLGRTVAQYLRDRAAQSAR